MQGGSGMQGSNEPQGSNGSHAGGGMPSGNAMQGGSGMEQTVSTNEKLQPGCRVLVVGQGAREHAIVWKLHHSRFEPKLFAAPGNPGMDGMCTRVPIAAHAVQELVQFALEARIELVVVGPEAPLSLGLVDACLKNGIPAFGPTQAAAELESSKAFAKDLMKTAGVPTAAYEVFTEATAAKAYIETQGAPIVVKADGLAAGKGVIVAETTEDAYTAIDDILIGQRFGESGRRVVIESFLDGQEASLMFFVDGDVAVPMVPARDYKRIGEGNQGPNTGGMGSVAPVLRDRPELVAEVERTIVQPVLRELKTRGIIYQGVLYVGLMVTKDGRPMVIEFNARFGDPETEVVLPLLRTDLLEVMWSTAHHSLRDVRLEWSAGHAVCVVLAAPGYPEKPVVGQPIQFAHGPSDLVFHAGTISDNGILKTSGGRVLTAVGLGTTRHEAQGVAYRIAETIYFEGKQIRRDIGN